MSATPAEVAYTDATGRVFCPTHREYAPGDVESEQFDNSAMDELRCDECGTPIAVFMLAARAARFQDLCFSCRKSVRASGNARPCPAHMTYSAEILVAIVDGTSMPVPPWLDPAATT